MPLPCPGPAQISLGDIQGEFGGSNPISINEYYRGSGLVPESATTVPKSGQISFSDFFCTLAEYVLVISSNTTDLNLQTAFNNAFGGSAWSSSVPKRVVINSGVIVGATITSNYAINAPSGRGGTLRIDNNGSIQGAGGAANGGTGGSAIFAGSSGISINNQGTIYAGGGGGGRGGTGGQGFYTTTSTVVNGLGYSGIRGVNISGCNQSSWLAGCSSACQQRYGSTVNGNTVYAATPCGYTSIGLDLCFPVCKYSCNRAGTIASESWTCSYNSTVTNTIYTAGGEGGNGGVGRGYNRAATGGSAGSAGGLNAGTGGTGGAGGDWGTSGETGKTGSNGNASAGLAGLPGGLAGFYIVNNGNVTWIANGTRAGRVG